MPFVGGNNEADESLSKQGLILASEKIYRCALDLSIARPAPDGDGVWDRTSYLLNSQLSHKTRRYGHWNFLSLLEQVGTSNFIDYTERNAAGIAATGGDPKQDDFDIWLGTPTIQPWIAWDRHSNMANYLYLDGHVRTLTWEVATPDLFPDHVVLTQDSSYPN